MCRLRWLYGLVSGGIQGVIFHMILAILDVAIGGW